MVAQIEIRGRILKMEGEYVVVIGILYTCNALQHKPAFIATR